MAESISDLGGVMDHTYITYFHEDDRGTTEHWYSIVPQ